MEDENEDGDDFNLAEIGAEGSEDEDDFAQLDADIDLEDKELMFNEVAEFLAQISDEDKLTLHQLVSQVLAEQYSEDGNILLAQADGELKASENEDLDAVAEFLAELSAEDIQRMNALVQTKGKEMAEEEAKELAQIDADVEFEQFEDNQELDF